MIYIFTTAITTAIGIVLDKIRYEIIKPANAESGLNTEFTNE